MRERLPGGPWSYVAVAAAAMGAAGTYQFVWSSLRPAVAARTGAGEATLGTVFTVFVVAQTVSQFPAGRLRDRRGPRLPAALGGVLMAAGYAGTALATDPLAALLSYGLGGVGAGAVYTVAVNTPVKWFTDRRGLATGVVTMAYGGASVAVIPYVRRGIAGDVVATLAAVAAVTGVAGLLAGAVLRDPDLSADGDDEDGTAGGGRSDDRTGSEGIDGSPSGGGTDGRTDDEEADDRTRGEEIDGRTAGEEAGGRASDDRVPDGRARDGTERAYTWRETIRTWQFWVLYATMVAVNAVGLMIIGTAVDFAGQYGLGAAVATAAASAVALSDSAGIVAVGGLSDRVGRERTVAATVALSGLAVGGAVLAGEAGLAAPFLAALGAAAFFRSPVFSVVPALVGEYYGRARSSENYALLYTAKVWGGVGGGVVASLLIARVGWSTAFLLGAGALVAAGLLAGLLRPVDGGPESGTGRP